jgi:glycosyltransferase involved in cell wall biosynthesis
VPDHLFRVLVVHSITPGTYEYARAVRDHCHATVAVSPRIRDDLVRRHGFRDDAVSMVPNGVELAGREVRRDARGPGLKVLVLGRVEHEAKGVLDVPKIATLLRDTASTFTIAGDGPDLARLQRACEPFRQRVALLGRVSPGDVPGLLARHDVLLLPSRFEGFPLALIEAMAFGCVPVASLISGVTNFVVEHGKTGLLFPVGSVKAAAAALQTLSADRELLDRMSVAGATIARRDFDAAVMARKYAELLRGLCVQRPPIAPPLDIGAWQYPSELRPSWRSSLPRPVKNVLRIIRERSRYMSAT